MTSKLRGGALLLLLCTAARAEDVKAPPPRFDARIDWSRVHFDEPGDGALWARGRTWKARFDATGFTYLPFLGSHAPRNHPVRMTLAAPATAATAPVRAGNRVDLDRGALIERYLLSPDGIEQQFVIREAPRGQDLVVRLVIETDLTPALDVEGFLWSGPSGGVRYGRATALDASGASVAVAATLEGAVLALRVPAGFLAAAQFPVTIDPFISTFVPGGSPTADEFAPDVSFDRGYRRYLVVWETGFSSTDHDVWAQVHDRAGSVEPGMGAFVDMTTEYWARPRVGENENSNAFTVVAAVGDPNASPPRRVVKGRNRLAPPPLTQYAPYAVSAGTADDAEPEFGGDACECYPSFHLVVWVRTVAPGNRDIIARHLIVDGRPNGPELVLGGSPEDEFHIAVSASVGARPFSAQRWNVVWTRADSTRPGNLDLWGAQIYWDGTVVRPAFPIDDSPEVDDHAAVSSVVDPGGTNRRWLVVWERQGPGDTDLHARVLAGASPVTEVNLVALEGGQREGLAQMRPRVDTDGYRFVVTYAEERTPGGPDLDVFASTFDLRLDSVLGLSEGHVPLGASARIESVPRIANALNAEFLGFRYGVVWESGAGADRNVEAALYDGLSPGGGYTLVPETGCDNHFLEPTGIPALGQTISVRMFGRRFRPFFLLGVQIPPAPVCPLACRLGVDPVSAWVVPTDNNATLVVGIPGEGALVGLRVAVQGVDLSLQPNICPTGYELYTSPTLLVTIR